MLIDEGSLCFATQAVNHGFCALTIEQRNFGECGGSPNGPDCFHSSMAALLIGRTTVAERVWDVSRAIDAVAKYFPQTDSRRVVCVRNSGGGTTAFYAACLDKQIFVTVPSCSVCTFDDSITAMEHCACNYIPKIRLYFDMGDLAGLIAPRKLLVVAGNQDPIFPLKGVVKNYAIVEKMYHAAETSENCRLIIGEGGHKFYPEEAWDEIIKMIGTKDEQ